MNKEEQKKLLIEIMEADKKDGLYKTNNMTRGSYPINPIPDLNSHPSDWYGLTKREYFAAMAMQGLLTRVPKRDGGEADLGILESKRIVEESIIMADAIIEQLNK